MFRIKPHTDQRHSEGINKTFCTAGNPTGTEPDLPLSVECLLWRHGTGALAEADLGHRVCDISLLGGPTIELPRR